MPPDEPAWWYGPAAAPAARILEPVAKVWSRVAARRWSRAVPYRARLPVICIGNFTAGGTGKTPLALHIAGQLQRLGHVPVILTRGYGGRARGPRWVDARRDTGAEVGDEPLLLARAVPVLVARDRAAGARAIEADGARGDVIVMDDGLQNPALAKDLTLAVVDGQRGVGNGRVIPAGPLRAPLDVQLARVDAVVINQPDGQATGQSAVADWFRRQFAGPVLAATTGPSGDTAWLVGKPVVAYAGIGAPPRFFDLLRRLGAEVRHEVAFPDHHRFTAVEARRLLALAEQFGSRRVTTQKDLARLAGATGDLAALHAASTPLPIALRFEARDEERLAILIETALHRRQHVSVP